MLEKFLKEELAGEYEVIWRYEFRSDSLVVEMRDGLLKKNRIISMNELRTDSSANLEFMMVQILRAMMLEISEYRERYSHG